MVLIKSFNYNFTTSATQQSVQKNNQNQFNDLRSFSKEFKTNFFIKSNIQKKKIVPTVEKKRSV